MIKTLQRFAIAIAVASFLVNVVITIVSLVIWRYAATHNLLKSVEFVSNVSMLALVFAGVSGMAAGLAGLLAIVPTDDVVADKITGDDE